jgi:hypothetical protein
LNASAADPFLLRPEDNLRYVGLVKSSDVTENLRYFIIIFLLLTLDRIVKLKMRFKRVQKGEELLSSGSDGYRVLFENVTTKHLDMGMVQFGKYLANFGFYRFGLEV